MNYETESGYDEMVVLLDVELIEIIRESFPIQVKEEHGNIWSVFPKSLLSKLPQNIQDDYLNYIEVH